MANGLSLSLDVELLTPLIQAVVREVLHQVEQAQAAIPDRMAFSEEEAAALLGLEWYQLRDERLRGRVRAYVVVNGQVRYSRDDVLAYLTRQEWSKETARKGHPGKKKTLASSKNGHSRNGHAQARDLGLGKRIVSGK
jgi:hypothetical protein